MSTVKLQGPAGFGGLSHQGVEHTPDADGTVDVPAHLPNEILAAHGLKAVEPKKGPKKLEPLAKSAKGGDDTSSADGSSDGGSSVKPAQKGAKSAKGGEQ